MLKCATSFCSLYAVITFQCCCSLMFTLLCTCDMQNMKRPLASRSLHSHGAAGASKLLLVYSEHCLAVNHTLFGRIPWRIVFKAGVHAKFQGIDFEFTYISSAVHKLLFPRGCADKVH